MIAVRDLKKGDVLPEIKRKITLEHIRDYAKISGDYNPLHIDEHFAKETSFGGVVAHGMLTLAYVSEMMAGLFGINWFSDGHLDIRFKNAARPGDELTLGGEIVSVVKRKTVTTISCDIHCGDQNEQPILIGSCRIRLSQ